MTIYQQCRYKNTIQNIPIRLVHGQQLYVYLEDVHFRCPKVDYFTLDGKTIPFEYDNNGVRLLPLRIQAYEGKIINCHTSPNNDQNLINIEKKNENVNALLRQNYQLTEKSVPDLFIVFPEDASNCNPADWFRLKYRLYLLCEYENGNRHHLAFHEGYELKQPREFLQKYGPYIRKMLEIVKLSLSVGSLVVPQMAHIVSDPSSSSILRGQTTNDKLGIQIEKLNSILIEVEKNFNITTDSHIHHVEGPALRQLEYFINKIDENKKLGNLHCTNSDDGHIRWMCVRHHNTPHCKSILKGLCDNFQELGGQIQYDIATIQGIHSKDISKLFNIIFEGLPISSIILQNLEVNEKDFDRLLQFISRQSLIRHLTLEKLTVSSSIRNIKKRTVTLKLHNVLEINVNLTIHSTVLSKH